MSAEHIRVEGPAHRVAIVGAYLAARWLSSGRRLTLIPDARDDGTARLLARPDHLRFHSDIGLSFEHLVQHAEAKGVFAPLYASPGEPVRLPFSPIGPSQFGVEFQHFWLRANQIAGQPDLLEFCPALALEVRTRAQGPADVAKAGIPFGLDLDLVAYTRLLLKLSQAKGAHVLGAGEDAAADLVISCWGSAEPGWSRGTISLADTGPLPGLEWQVCVNAARRFVGLSATPTRSHPEQREYTRLARLEAGRVFDMEALLFKKDPSDTLRRKIDLFAACGRIPTEDFEVFTPPEWLAALWSSGIRPRRYDRMAERMPQAQLLEWMARLQAQAQAWLAAGQAA